MPIYLVEVQIGGIMRVHAETPTEAAELAASATPTLSGKHLFDANVVAATTGEMQNHELKPQNVKSLLRTRLH